MISTTPSPAPLRHQFWASSPIELQVSSQNFTGNSKIQKEEEDSKK